MAIVSRGVYRLPYQAGTRVKVTNDHLTHTPVTRLDMVGIGGDEPYRIAAAASGVIRYIVDSHSERRPLGSSPCNNNYVWIEHDNGEWTKYSHMTKGSVTEDAGLSVGDRVAAGAFLGCEGDVGCATNAHLHFEVAVPIDPAAPINADGFIIGGTDRNRIPRFCGVPGWFLMEDDILDAAACEPPDPWLEPVLHTMLR